MKSIFILTTFLFVSCGQDANTDIQTAVPESNTRGDNGKKSESVTSVRQAENRESANSGTTAALAFINSYVDNCKKMRDAIPTMDWVNASDFVTQNFKDEMNRLFDEANRQDPELGPEADPIFDAQDFPDQGFVVDEIDDDFLTVSGINWTDFKLRMKVARVSDKWLVDGSGIINIPPDKRIRR